MSKKYSTRLPNGNVTSINLPEHFIAMYCCTLNTEQEVDNHSFILDTINEISKDWDSPDGKGFGSFVFDSMCFSLILDGQEEMYNDILETL
jgi:hypothetical protein